jgi:hypothetical protein
MSGTIRINTRDVWTPPGWIYDALLERVSLALKDTRPVISQMLDAATTGRSVGYLSLEDCDSSTIIEIAAATEAMRDGLVAAGAESLHDPSFFLAFVARIDEVLSMLTRDERVLQKDR